MQQHVWYVAASLIMKSCHYLHYIPRQCNSLKQTCGEQVGWAAAHIARYEFKGLGELQSGSGRGLVVAAALGLDGIDTLDI